MMEGIAVPTVPPAFSGLWVSYRMSHEAVLIQSGRCTFVDG